MKNRRIQAVSFAYKTMQQKVLEKEAAGMCD